MKNLWNKLFKDWSMLELILLFGGIVITFLMAIIFKSDLLTPIASIIGIITALLLAKGKVIGQFFGLAVVVLYSIVSFKQAYYGEVIIYVAIMLPLYIFGIISWLKNRNHEKKVIIVNEIKWKEWLILSLVTISLFIGFHFMLKTLNTANLFVSTLSVIDNCFAVYLVARRSKYGFMFYIINDIILIALWGIPVIQGSLLLLPMLMNPIINLINDTYGIINFSKLKKQQN